METFKHQDLDIKYIREGKGEPIIFLHNGGTSHVIWKDVAAQLSGSYEIFALDLLGYGASSKPGNEYPLDKHLDILSAFIKHHQLENIILVGNCMGSAMSLAYAMRQPADIRALVLVNPLTFNTFTAGQLGWSLRLRKSAPGVSQTINNWLGGFRLNRFISEQSLRMQFGSIGQKKNLEKTEDLCACFTANGQMKSLLLTLDDLVNYDVFDRFTPPADFPPICTIWGLENKILSAKAGRKLNATLHPQREEWIEGGGHLVMLETPEKIATVIREFIGAKEVAA
ncbi:MAG: alpha/beta hydrolase [Chitinophagales bacterium]|nr:alpha/beta hydrolase [Chitinophagales bacterium]